MAELLSFRAQWARRLTREKISAELEVSQHARHSLARFSPTRPSDGFALTAPNQLPPRPEFPKVDFPENTKVCIVGAGMAGLYIAMILDSVSIPNLSYEILEADKKVGGRVKTHYFSDVPHDYYDVGAMRFPQIPSMHRTFDLFTRLSVPTIPYYLNADGGSQKCPSMFNDILTVDGDPQVTDPYRVSISNQGSVPDDVVANENYILEVAFGPFKKAMSENFEKGFESLLEQDNFSTRQYLRNGGKDGKATKYSFFSIQWMETQDTSSGLFDQAFSESVIDSFDFDNKGVNWRCVDGGTSLVAERMQAALKKKVECSKRVSSIGIDRTIDSGNPHTNSSNMVIKCVDESTARAPYATVFNTTALGCLQRMDLTNLELHPSQKDAIRCLHYDDSAKVAIKFSRPWWITDCEITRGGAASTDLPLRTCVYPSYNINDPPGQPAVLLCSYTWAQDATRIGSLVQQATPESETELLELLFRDLALLHQRNISYDTIKSLYMTHHAFSWSHSAFTSGAFALFGPGQFENFYPYLSRPTADAKFHIVGEASSAHHAWIVGALDSAYCAVYRFLQRFGRTEEIKVLKEKWGTVGELDTGENGTVHLQVLLGMLTPDQHVKVGPVGRRY